MATLTVVQNCQISMTKHCNFLDILLLRDHRLDIVTSCMLQWLWKALGIPNIRAMQEERRYLFGKHQWTIDQRPFDSARRSLYSRIELILTDPFAGLSLGLEDGDGDSSSASPTEEKDDSKARESLEEAIAAIPLVLSNPTSRHVFLGSWLGHYFTHLKLIQLEASVAKFEFFPFSFWDFRNEGCSSAERAHERTFSCKKFYYDIFYFSYLNIIKPYLISKRLKIRF